MLHIASAFDENYLQPFCGFVSSIMATQARGSIHLHVIYSEVGNEHIQALTSFVHSFGQRIEFYAVDDVRVDSFVTMSTWTKAVYYRLYFPFLVPEQVNRLLYLDADMLVLNSLEPLYNAPLGGKPVGAVYDNYVKVQPLIGIDAPGEYFNSGMLLMDVPMWRAQKVSEEAMTYLEKFPERIRFVDQCALNAVLKNNWQHLPTRFNLLFSYLPSELSKNAMREIRKGCVVLHFTLQRPWHMLCKNRFRELYFDYVKHSPWSSRRIVTDWSVSKLPAYFRLKLIEFYFDSPVLQSLWKKLKGRATPRSEKAAL